MKRLLKILKWTLLTSVILILFAILFRGPAYRHLFHYKVLGQRTSYKVTDKALKVFIDSFASISKPENIEDIIKLSLQITSARLCYKVAKNDNDPNKLIESKNAHCVGYSAFFSTTCNYLLDKFGYSDKCISEPLIGQIYFLNINVHSFYKSAFFKDHDFNSIINKETGERYFVDPTINDYFGIDYITVK